MTNTELQIKGLLTELQARTDQMSVTVAKVEGLERELAAAQKNSDLAQAETYGQFDRARRAEADRDRLRGELIEKQKYILKLERYGGRLRMALNCYGGHDSDCASVDNQEGQLDEKEPTTYTGEDF